MSFDSSPTLDAYLSVHLRALNLEIAQCRVLETDSAVNREGVERDRAADVGDSRVDVGSPGHETLQHAASGHARRIELLESALRSRIQRPGVQMYFVGQPGKPCTPGLRIGQRARCIQLRLIERPAAALHIVCAIEPVVVLRRVERGDVKHPTDSPQVDVRDLTRRRIRHGALRGLESGDRASSDGRPLEL